MAKKKVLFHQDNASQVIGNDGKTDGFGLRNAPHPAYSPDLAPSDFWLFCRSQKDALAKEIWRLWTNCISVVENYIVE